MDLLFVYLEYNVYDLRGEDFSRTGKDWVHRQPRATAPVHSHAAPKALGAAHAECWRALLMRWFRWPQGVISTLIEDHLMIRGSSHPR